MSPARLGSNLLESRTTTEKKQASKQKFCVHVCDCAGKTTRQFLLLDFLPNHLDHLVAAVESLIVEK